MTIYKIKNIEKLKSKTKHEQIIEDFLLENPNWEKYNLRKKIIDGFAQLCDEWETDCDDDCKNWNEYYSKHIVKYIRYRPDAFYVDVTNKTINLLEVDGTSITDNNKLNSIIDLWWLTDGEGWFLTLTIINVYTNAINFFDDNAIYEIDENIRQSHHPFL